MESIGSSPITLGEFPAMLSALFRSAGEYIPRPRYKVISIDNFAPSLKVAMCISGFKISTSLSHLIALAVTQCMVPLREISTVLGPSQKKVCNQPLDITTISVASS